MLSPERLLDLLVARATEGLPVREADELERDLLERGDLDADDIDLAAAAVFLAYDAGRARTEPMPETLRQRLLATARGLFDPN
jgi:hypothetical protein